MLRKGTRPACGTTRGPPAESAATSESRTRFAIGVCFRVEVSVALEKHFFVLLASSLVLASGCSNEAPPPNVDDGGPDSGIASDVGVEQESDSGNSDAAPSPDQGPTDSGILDECDPLAQSGCQAPTTKCIIERGGAECATPGAEDKAIGEVCGGGQCQPGMVCIGDGSGTDPICRQICDRETGAGCAGLPFEADCLERVRNTNWGVCSPLPPVCDVLTQEPCPVGESCQPFLRFSQTFDLRCRPAGPGLEGESCMTERCERGLVCINIGGAPQCTKVCDDDTWCTATSSSACSGRVNGVAVKYCSG
jgi:hypothetical protein